MSRLRRWSRHPVLVAAACVASGLVVFAALARVTAMTLELERSERAALERATQEENVRIALWRLDATLADLFATEGSRSASRFRDEGEPSGLPAPAVRARFELDHAGTLEADREIETPEWAAELPVPPAPPPEPEPPPPPPPPLPPEEPAGERDPWAVVTQTPGVLSDRINVGGNESGQQAVFLQSELNTQAFQRRQELGEQSARVRPVDEPPGVEAESAFEPRWLDGELVLLRRVRRGNEELLQGTWLDWPSLREQLLEQVGPVVPHSRLEPLADADASEVDDPGRRLALLPARLVPGPMPETEPRDWTPVRWTIAAAWGAAAVGLVGLGALLFGALSLGRRRADFVSAVTHELRSPLTSFRLHTDLLAQGAVPPAEEPEVRATLEREAGRLSHLVENVLAFSRLERRPVRPEERGLGDLLERIVPLLEERAARSGLELVVDSLSEHAGVRVRSDAAAVERILLNLVDNACKYAADAEPAELVLETEVDRRTLSVFVSDHGAGVEPDEVRRIFRPFHRSASRAAGSEPGVGLGLALSRRLARAMGGDLRHAAADGGGARFELRLRRA